MERPDIVILGAGESGVGAAILAKKLGLRPFVSDRGNIAQSTQQHLESQGIAFESGQHSEAIIMEADLIIKSPGIPDQAPLIQRLRAAGKAVIAEVEFAARHTNATLIGITGSNGKTTTTQLLYRILQQGDLDVAMGGNVGESFARLVATRPAAYYVLELSSFQLDGIDHLHSHIALLLNITPDHLDRYEYKLELYAQSKYRITRNQQSKDWLIYNAADQNIAALLNAQPPLATKIPVDLPSPHGPLEVKGHAYDLSQSTLLGPHNRFNAHCAIEAALLLGLSPDQIQQGINGFVNAPHRLEQVATKEGVLYINDSKATNVDSVYYALKAMDRPIVWIAGGIDKGNEYDKLEPLVEEKVHAMICLGVDNVKLLEVFGPRVEETEEVRTMPDAIATAKRMAREGEVVLLSPACSSFDLFDNFAARGDQFREEVLKLPD